MNAGKPTSPTGGWPATSMQRSSAGSTTVPCAKPCQSPHTDASSHGARYPYTKPMGCMAFQPRSLTGSAGQRRRRVQPPPPVPPGYPDHRLYRPPQSSPRQTQRHPQPGRNRPRRRHHIGVGRADAEPTFWFSSRISTSASSPRHENSSDSYPWIPPGTTNPEMSPPAAQRKSPNPKTRVRSCSRVLTHHNGGGGGI